jgi:hypothetical protein
MVNNVIGVVNYVIAARPSLRNFMIADIGLPEHFRGHGYCSYVPEPSSTPTTAQVPGQPSPSPTPIFVSTSWFVSFLGSVNSQGNIKGTIHPNKRGHAAWAARYLTAIAAPKPSRAPEFTVRVHLGAFRVFLLGIGPEGSNGACNGNSVTGIPVKLLAFASLSEAGFDKPEAAATYQVTVKPAGFQFQPSEWYQFSGDAVLTFPLSSVETALDVTIGSPLCNGSPSEPQSEIIHIHRPRHTSDGSDLAGAFQLRSSPDARAIEVSGCIDVAPAEPPPLDLPPNAFLGPCQQRLLAPSGP